MKSMKLNFDFDVMGATCKTCNESLPENRLIQAHVGIGHRVYVLTKIREPKEMAGQKLQIAMQVKDEI